MSVHSLQATIKHKKGAEDAKRGKIFSKLNREIAVAVRDGGPNIETNGKLKVLFEKAREYNMPKDNIDRILKKASGEAQGETLEEFMFEIIGPGESAILVEGITDNKNRALGNLKKILSHFDAKLVSEGALKWQFDRKGFIDVEVPSRDEELEMKAIECGADDIAWQENLMTIYTSPDNLENVRKALESKNIKAKTFGFSWVAKEEKNISEDAKQSLEKLFEALDDDDDVQELYSNISL